MIRKQYRDQLRQYAKGIDGEDGTALREAIAKHLTPDGEDLDMDGLSKEVKGTPLQAYVDGFYEGIASAVLSRHGLSVDKEDQN